METKISVLLADPGEQYRAAYSKAIGQETDMELVAQTDNGLRAEELITKFQPDVVVLDLVLPNLDGLSLLTHLRAKNASSRVIVTSAICNDQVLMECAELGTTYFMQKPFDPPLLGHAARRGRARALARERRYRRHPRDRRARAHQGLPVPARGDLADDRRHGHHQLRDEGALSRGRAQVQHDALAR